LSFLISISVCNASLYDDFKNSGFYTLSDGQTSLDGKWQNVYNGGGASGVTIDGGKNVFFMYPRAPISLSDTNANLVKSTQQFSNFKMDVDVKTVEQLRRNSTPNTWEAAWILFRYTDTFHYYWFVLKHDGLELGKKDCDYCTNSKQGQIFLSTNNKPHLKVGDWSRWKITAIGNDIRLEINGTRVIDFVDPNMSNKLASGSIGLYTEDAYVV
jgi:Domain of Unknown Function (DUF1080)